jgi:hypothetical protein
MSSSLTTSDLEGIGISGDFFQLRLVVRIRSNFDPKSFVYLTGA